MNFKNAFKSHSLCSKHSFFVVISLLFVLLIMSFPVISLFSGVSSFVTGIPDKIVNNETELKNAINDVQTGQSVVIALGNDISLTERVIVPAGKDITLTSNSITHFYKLIGGLTVQNDGILRLDGINVTDASNSGISVDSDGLFILYRGEISGNISPSYMVGLGMFFSPGGGVYNAGTFEMYGGKISNNSAYITASNDEGYGGGVYNTGTFKMFDGEISNNYAVTSGAGVYNVGVFEMYGGEISDHNVWYTGGGVSNSGTFTMTGGIITGNKAAYGGGVATYGVFTMTGGTISNNFASSGGGVFGSLEYIFVSDGAVFENNRASTAYSRHPRHDALYKLQIGDNVIWTAPFTQGYNNYDIQYSEGSRFTVYTLSVYFSYAESTGAGNYIAGERVTVNAGTRDGFTFNGWLIGEGDITLPNSATTTFTMPARNVAIIANWVVTQDMSYNIIYELDGGNNAAGNPLSYSSLDLFPITIANPTKLGYDFVGWTVQYTYNSQTDVLVPVTSYDIPDGTIGDIVLTANWIQTGNAIKVIVGTETALRNAINNAMTNVPVTIIFTTDIQLINTNSPIIIPAGKDITLTNSDSATFFKLIGGNGVNVITVERGGILRIDGIIITHILEAEGSGVIVNVGGAFYLYSGEIFGNTGSGVITSGIFTMFGGVIANNTFHGVSIFQNDGTVKGNFTMFGGVIANNTAIKTVFSTLNPETVAGGGVYNSNGNFTMFGGVIANNTATSGGGYGGGIRFDTSDFTMFGGVIANNTAISGGGGVYIEYGSFKLFDGVIANNTASNSGGGGVSYGSYFGGFTMFGGVIANNTAIK
ncbi:MAG: InlB B-repeat-containing protein [Candidatus Bathyarchaeota archaeon]|nr:InlB B-repeat-containing protein [Candidatus Termiticorpusculum sp.]